VYANIRFFNQNSNDFLKYRNVLWVTDLTNGRNFVKPTTFKLKKEIVLNKKT